MHAVTDGPNRWTWGLMDSDSRDSGRTLVGQWSSHGDAVDHSMRQVLFGSERHIIDRHVDIGWKWNLATEMHIQGIMEVLWTR